MMSCAMILLIGALALFITGAARAGGRSGVVVGVAALAVLAVLTGVALGALARYHHAPAVRAALIADLRALPWPSDATVQGAITAAFVAVGDSGHLLGD